MSPCFDQEQYSKFLDIFRRDRTGFNAHREFVFPFKATFHSTSVKHNEAQFLETAREVKFEIVQLWGLPPHAVGLLDKATFTNIEQQAIDLVTQAYLRWRRKIGQAAKVGSTSLKDGLYDWETEAVLG